MAIIPAYTINGFTRPELIVDGFGNIVLDDAASAFAQAYGIKALYLGCPPGTPYPPVLPSLLFPVDTNGAANTVAEGAAANTTVGITALSTSLLGFPVTYSLTGDSSGGGFKINATTGVVSVADPSKIDFESNPGHSYSITVRANDGILTTFRSFTIGVSDVAPSAPSDVNAGANTVVEGAANGTAVGVTVSATDVNGGTVTYSLTNNANGAFTINATTGVITVANSTKIDYESAPGHAYTVTAQASDGTLTNSQTFTIAVSDVAPSAPSDTNGATNTIAEGAANGSTVGITASSLDPNGPATTYSLTDSAGGRFAIDSSTGVVTVANGAAIDFETAVGHAYGITVQATNGALSTSSAFSISIANVAPNTPTDGNAAANTVAEGAANGTAVGVTAASTDPGGNPAVTWSLTDDAGGRFAIDPNTGIITVANGAAIDFESAPGHAYTVTAQSSDGVLATSQSFTINVADVAPVAPIDGNAGANTVAEGAANGSTVGVTASSTDVNGGPVTYSLTGDTSGGGFTIDSTTGVVTVADGSKIDYETAAGHAYTVTAQASDGTLTNSQTFTIAVSDVAPSTPVDSNAAANVVVEGAANGTEVGITASATDLNGPAVTYSLIGDTSGGGFTINAATGVVTVADATKLDYESAAGHAYTVTAQASDGTLTSSQIFAVIAVTDEAPSTPTDSNGAANTVAEGAANGSTVGVTASSTDVNGPAVTYSLTGDTSGGGFTINAATGVVTVADATKIDFESSGGSYTVTAQASDGTLSSSQAFTIAVSDVAPATPVDSDGGTNAVAEGAANGSTVGVTASSTDVNGPAVTYSLTGDTSGGGFTINAVTGVVTVADATKIDYETAAGHAYTVTAQASDGTLSNSQTFTIAVSDVAPSTPVDVDGAANTIVEGAANGSTVGVTASSTDVNGPAATWALVGDTSGGGFTINAATGVITIADASKIDFETSGGSYTVTAQSSDGTLASSQAFVIAVTDVAPSTPVDSDAAANAVAEGSANGSTVGVTASSIDINGPAVTYSLIGDTSGGGFTINAATGVVTVADAGKLDFESSGGSYTVTAQASDGTLSGSQTFTIAVTDVAPSTPADADAGTNTIAEGAANGSTVGVTASSADVNGPAVTYSLVGDTSGGGFTINAATGVVTVADASKIDYETSGGSYTVVAQASDGTLTNAQSFTIAVSDVAPSTPVDSDGAANTIVEGAANGSTVGVTASSTDLNGPTVTYSLIGDSSGGGFTINSATGVVTIADASKIDFETSGGSYTVTAQSSDGTLGSSQAFVIAVSDVAPLTPTDSDATANSVVQSAAVGSYTGLTASSTDVNGPGVTYTLIGDTSGGGFTVNAATGAVTVADSSKIIFITNPTTYDVTVDVSDGTLHSQNTFSINVDPNASPIIDSDGAGATAAVSAAENQTAVTTVHATDPDDSPVTPVAYSIVGGDDQLKFAIDSSTGVLTFVSPPDFENPADTSTAGNNTYIVVVQATDGAAIDQQTVTVTVTDVNDAPVITSNGGGANASINVNENSTAVTTVTSTDQETPAQTLTYSLVGGADQAKFSIDSTTGVLTFNTAPDFEVPTDPGSNNNYDVVVRVTDNGSPNLHDDQTITVHVQNVNEAPDTAAATVTGNEDAAAIAITLTGADVDAGDSAASFHITGIPNVATQGILYSDIGLTTQVTEGADVAAVANTATLYFVPNANYNTHAGAVTFNAAATDTHGLTDATPATETINVTAVDDAPVNNGVPANFIVGSGFTHAITGLSVSDIDANEVGTPNISTTLASSAGIVTIGNGANGTNAGITGGAVITSNGGNSVVLTGSTDQINTTLGASNGVVYAAADNAGNTTATVTMTTNDAGHNGTGGPLTDVSTIQVGVIPQVWFIDSTPTSVDATAPRGSQANPFSDVHEFNTSSGPGANDYIYVKEGTYDGEGINLKAGQTLLGDDQALTFTNPLPGGGTIVIEDASGARPVISVNAANATDQGIALASNNTIKGINVVTNAAGQTGIDDSGASVGTLNISDGNVTGSGQAINLTHGGTGGNVSLGTVSSSGGATGIALGGALATHFNATTGTLSGHTGAEFSVNGGTGAVSYGGNIGDGSGVTSVSIVNHSTGGVTLSGTITDGADANGGIGISGNTGIGINFTGGSVALNTGIGDGVSITNNAGSVINFTNGGLVIQTTNGTAFQDTVAGTVVVGGLGNTITTNGNGSALNLSHVTVGGGFTFDSVSSTNSTGTAVAIDTVTGGAIALGTGSISGSDGDAFRVGDGAGTTGAGGTSAITYSGSISKTDGSGQAVDIQDRAAGAGNITLSGNITHNVAANTGILLDDNAAGTITFSGSSKAITSTTATAVNLTDNTGATIAFTNGGLVINTTSSNGFNATGAGPAATTGGTVTASGSGNTITSTTGTALNVVNTTIGANDLTFQSISANGGANGIVLNNTGASGGLIVTGDSGSAVNSTGGTIQNTTGAGISLTNTRDVSLDQMNIQNTADDGIHGTTVTNFGFTNSTMTGAGNGANEFGIFITDLFGTGTINNSSVTNSQTNNLRIVNSSSTAGTLNIANSTFTTTDAANGGDAVSVQTDNTGNLTVNLTDNNDLNNSQGDGIQASANNTSTLRITADGSNSNYNGNLGSAINIAAANGAHIFALIKDFGNRGADANPANNTGGLSTGSGVDADSSGVADNGLNVINIQNFDTSVIDATVQNSVINGLNNNASGIRVIEEGNATINVEINNVFINGMVANGIQMQARAGTGAINATVHDTDVRLTNPLSLDAMSFESGSSAGGDANTLRLDLFNNDASATPAGQSGYQLRSRAGTTFQLEDFIGSGTNTADVAAWINNAPKSNIGIVNALLTGAGASFGTIADVPMPSLPMLAAAGGVQSASSTPGVTSLSQAQLDSVVAAAITQWAHAGASASQLAALAAVTFSVADLAGNIAGEQSPGHIVIDSDAAGHGWFVDATPFDNSEFTHAANAAGTDLFTDPTSAAAGHLDLLTTVVHELGHELGMPDLTAAADAHDLMFIDLVDGERRLPDAADVPLLGSLVVGTPGNDAINAGHGGNILIGGAGADNFVFSNVQPNAPMTPSVTPALTYVVDYSFAQGDSFDFSALTSAFHGSGASDAQIVRAVEDASGTFATLQVNVNGPGSNIQVRGSAGTSAASWVDIAQLDGIHAGDDVSVLIDSHAAVHVAHLHAALLV